MLPLTLCPPAAVDGEHKPTASRVDAVDRPDQGGHHAEQRGSPNIGRLDVDHRKPAQPCANLTPYFGVRAVATDQIASGNVMIQAVLEVLGATSGGDPQRLRGSSRS
jgi:hypothetical protein